jgi:hypothetical protein
MGRDTEFNFGHNVRDNADPWGRNTEPDDKDYTERKPLSSRREERFSSKVLASDSVSENGSYWQDGELKGWFFARLDVFESDAFQKMILLRLNSIKEEIRQIAGKETMDLSSYRGKESGNTRGKFENRDWLDSQKDLPKKGASKWKIDGVREAKKNKTGIIAFIDVTCGNKKRVMSLRKGFTLDAFMDELGTNTDKWKGKSIQLERGGDEGQYINVAQ